MHTKLRLGLLLVPLVCTPAVLNAQDAAGEADASADVSEPETVIVTGTRATGIDAFTSSSPVQMLSSAAVESAGRVLRKVSHSNEYWEVA